MVVFAESELLSGTKYGGGIKPSKVTVEPDMKYADVREQERLEIHQLMKEIRNHLLKPPDMLAFSETTASTPVVAGPTGFATSC